MQLNEFDDVPVSGQFDLAFRDICTYPAIDWRLLKSLAFNESELQPYVDGGLFRTPIRLYYDFDGLDHNDPSDCIKTVQRIFLAWWEDLSFLPEEDRIKYIILAYKLRFSDVRRLVDITRNFEELTNFFSPVLILEVKKIISFAQELENGK